MSKTKELTTETRLVSCYLKTKDFDRLEDFSWSIRKNKSKIIREAVFEYINKYSPDAA